MSIQSILNTKDVYVVKKVLSGSSMMLRGCAPSKGPPPTMTVHILFLQGPNSLEDFNAEEWRAREHLRKLVIGQSVKLAFVLGSSASVLVLVNGKPCDLGGLLLESGHAKLQMPTTTILKQLDDAFVDRMVTQYETAQQTGRLKALKMREQDEKGEADRVVIRTLADKKALSTLHETLQAQATCKGMVEQVLDATTVLMRVGDVFVAMTLAGLALPGPKDGLVGSTLLDRVHQEGLFVLETRLLQRDVAFRVVGLSIPRLVVSLQGPVASTAETLLEGGFVKTVDWGLQLLPEAARKALLAAQAKAQQARLRMWSDGNVPRAKETQAAATQAVATMTEPGTKADDNGLGMRVAGTAVTARWTGTVVKILSGDSLVIEAEDGKESRITLAGVRQPWQAAKEVSTTAGRQAGRGDSVVQVETGFRPLAKEWLRAKTIGKRVSVLEHGELRRRLPQEVPSGPEGGSTEGTRPAPMSITYATVLLNGISVAEGLVGRGLALVAYGDTGLVRGSPEQGRLQAQEEAAKKDGLGIHGPGEQQPMRRIVEVGDRERAMAMLPTLRRSNGPVEAVVEAILQGHKYRLLVSGHNCRIIFSVQDCSSYVADVVVGDERPPARVGDLEDDMVRMKELSMEVRQAVARLLLQRTCWIQVAPDVDKHGVFHGTLRRQLGDPELAWTQFLLGHGWAVLRGSMASLSARHSQLLQAQAQAQADRLGLWRHHEALALGHADGQSDHGQAGIAGKMDACNIGAGAGASAWQRLQAVVSDVRSLQQLSIQPISNAASLDKLMQVLREVGPTLMASSASLNIEELQGGGDSERLLVFKSSVDGLYYRALHKVGHQSDDLQGKAMRALVLVDYGNVENVSLGAVVVDVAKLAADVIESSASASASTSASSSSSSSLGKALQLIQSLPFQAVTGSLGSSQCLRVFPDQSYDEESMRWLCSVLQARHLDVLVSYGKNCGPALPKKSTQAFDKTEDDASFIFLELTEQLLARGLLFIPRKFLKPDTKRGNSGTLRKTEVPSERQQLAALGVDDDMWRAWVTAQAEARSSRRNGWASGSIIDLESDSDDDMMSLPPPPGLSAKRSNIKRK